MNQAQFYQFAAIPGLAAATRLLANRLRQPVIVAFIAIGHRRTTPSRAVSFLPSSR